MLARKPLEGALWLRMTPKLKATLAHFLASVALAALVAVGVFFIWYPDGLSDLLRGSGLFWLLIACDVVLGPLMSLVIFSPAKSKRMLAFDYSVVVAIQLAALGYGLSVVAASRPVFAVFSIDRLDLVSAFEVDATEARNAAALRTFPVRWIHGPSLVALKVPVDTAARNELLDFELRGGEAQTQPRYYVPFVAADMLARAHPLDALRATHPQIAEQAAAAAARAGIAPHAVVWLPARSRFGFHTALLNPSDGRVILYLSADAE